MMKTIVSPKPGRTALQVTLLSMLLLAGNFNGSMSSAKAASISNTQLRRDTIVINKKSSSKKYKIKLYPNATHEVLFFSASGESGKVYQFFLFDMDGKLAKQTQVRNKETTLLSRFDKGSYMFEVFSDDERIENGSVVVR